MRYCTHCVQPDTRPGIFINEESVCGACLWEDMRATIDWQPRKQELLEIAAWAKAATKEAYNCAIGVSGGKDSTFQALYARDVLHLRPLLVNCEPNDITPTGQLNIENLKRLGFDVISLRPNPNVLTKLVKYDYLSCLNPGKITEYPLWASTYIIADKFDIPLIIQGENAGLTLGASENTGTGGDAFSAFRLNTIRDNPYTRYKDAGVSVDELYMYHVDIDRLLHKGIRAVWLNYYAQEWSEIHNAAFSCKRGLSIRPADTFNPYATGYYHRYAGLDAVLLEINQFFKFIKFGFGQTTDEACFDLREGLISREEAIYLVREIDGQCGPRYIEWFCQAMQITEKDFWAHVNSFRGDMWRQNADQSWSLRDPIWAEHSFSQAMSVQTLTKRIEQQMGILSC